MYRFFNGNLSHHYILEKNNMSMNYKVPLFTVSVMLYTGRDRRYRRQTLFHFISMRPSISFELDINNNFFNFQICKQFPS